MCRNPVHLDPTDSQRAAAMQFLYDRIDYERARNVPYHESELKLERMHQLLERLDNPHLKLPIVHIAGTKGKGSTAAMIGSVLSSAGFCTGVFSSPHIDRLEERIAIDGQPCSSDELVELVQQMVPSVQEMDEAAGACEPPEIGPTYFEITAAMAMLHFARRKVDAALLEVGLGGRLDATNVCQPRISVITSISFDHTKQLGSTLESIAWEKAGIIKPGIPVVSGVVDQGPREVIRRACRERDCQLIELGVDFDYDYSPPRGLETAPGAGNVDFHFHAADRRYNYSGLSLGLLGRHQAANAAVGLAALDRLQQLGWEIPEAAIRAALAEVAWPARVEVIARQPAIVFDTAHNVASIDALVQVIEESFAVRRRFAVFATTWDKDVRGMLSRLLEQFDEVIFTRYLSNPRAVPPVELQEAALDLTGHLCCVCPDPATAWEEVRALATPEDLICVTGSFFLVAEMRRQMRLS